MEKTQTALQWLIENYLPLKRGIEVGHEHTIKVVEQAKAMEKEQVIDAYAQGFIEAEQMDKGAEQYYNETFNQPLNK
jgi:hypothetical protein